jgi:hypothetical protein
MNHDSTILKTKRFFLLDHDGKNVVLHNFDSATQMDNYMSDRSVDLGERGIIWKPLGMSHTDETFNQIAAAEREDDTCERCGKYIGEGCGGENDAGMTLCDDCANDPAMKQINNAAANQAADQDLTGQSDPEEFQ